MKDIDEWTEDESPDDGTFLQPNRVVKTFAKLITKLIIRGFLSVVAILLCAGGHFLLIRFVIVPIFGDNFFPNTEITPKNTLFTVGLVLLYFTFYLLPAINARQSGRSDSFKIFWINFSFGWTIIGWIIASKMASREHL